MSNAAVVPEETDLLCEGCGYTLNGLPTSSNCPECGKPIPESIGEHRHLSEFELNPSLVSFIRTTRTIIFNTAEFYRTLLIRTHTDPARRFSRIHLVLAISLFLVAVMGHALWLLEIFAMDRKWLIVVLVVGAPTIILSMLGLTRLATWLSAIEAKYWGMRLPYNVVARGLAFHNAHYLPTGLLAVVVTWGYRFLLASNLTDHRSDTRYLTALSGAVLISAGYLFRTYWIGMRNMMYANR